jgi:hypothetical protein
MGREGEERDGRSAHSFTNPRYATDFVEYTEPDEARLPSAELPKARTAAYPIDASDHEYLSGMGSTTLHNPSTPG